MNPLKLTFTANEQALTKTDNFTDFASNTVSYIEATFTLGENWSGYDSVRAVWKTDYYTISTVLDANFTCIVPTEVLRYKAKVFVNLVGSIVENDTLTDRLTTFPVLALTVKANAAVNGSETAPVTPSQFEQFVDSVRDTAGSISDYSYDSEAWAVGTRGGVNVPSTDPTFHNNSKYWAEQNAGLADEVADLKEDLNNANKGSENFSLYATFVNAGLSSGSLYPSQPYRIATNTIMSFDRDLYVTIDSDYRMGIHKFSGGSFVSDSGWQFGNIIIPKGTQFKVVIAKIADLEDTSSTADISLFVNKVQFLAKSNIADNFFTNGGIDILDLQWINGRYSEGNQAWVSQSNRVTTRNAIYANHAISVSAKSGYDFAIMEWKSDALTSANFMSDSGWLSDGVLEVAPNTYFTVGLRKNDNSDFTIEDGINAVRIKPLNSMSVVPNIINTVFDYNLFKVGSLSQGVFYSPSDNPNYAHRVATQAVFRFDYDITLSCKKGFAFAYHTFNSSGAFVTDSGWKTDATVIPKGTRFRITIHETPESSSTPNIETYVYAVRVYSGVIGQLATQALDESFANECVGDAFTVNRTRYSVESTGILAPSADSLSAWSFQGFGCYNGIIIQFYNPDVVALIDYASGSEITHLSSPTGHGNAIAFLNDYYDADDEFPTALVSDTLSSPLAYQVRITRSAITKLKTISFPIERAGYYANAMFDSLNNIIYTAGYTEESWEDNTSGHNRMIFAKWDWTQLTNNEDSTYTPLFIESFTTPFIHTMQGSAYHNGNLFIMSSKSSVGETVIYVIDPIGKRVRSRMDTFPSNVKNYEAEAIFFTEEDGKDIALVKNQGAWLPYYKIVFNN